jgi:hypothetical protein
MDDSCNLQKVIGGCFRRIWLAECESIRGRENNAVLRDDTDLLDIWNWKVAARKRKCWRKKTKEVMA